MSVGRSSLRRIDMAYGLRLEALYRVTSAPIYPMIIVDIELLLRKKSELLREKTMGSKLEQGKSASLSGLVR